MSVDKFFRSGRYLILVLGLVIAGKTFAIDLKVGDRVQFDGARTVEVIQGEVVDGVYYEIFGVQMSPDEQMVYAELAEIFDPGDRHKAQGSESREVAATISFPNVERFVQLKGVSFYEPAAPPFVRDRRLLERSFRFLRR